QTERHFGHHLHNANPTILLSMLIALILNVFGHVTRPWCNATLALLNILLKTATRNSTHLKTTPTKQLDDAIPCDIRTVRSKFELEPITKVYATCLRCCCTYAPDN
ncbi:hypothetical protein BU15DRAFT_16399, partial [Melanogaster broomeanus]